MAKVKARVRRTHTQTTSAEVAQPVTPHKKTVKRLVKKTVKVRKTKKQIFQEQWLPENMTGAVSQYVRESIEVAAREFGDPDICTADKAGRLVVGVPLPSFALEFLVQNNVWPLGRVMQIDGPEGSVKSGLAIEVGRWFIDKTGGFVEILEHESKYSPDWTNSIVGWDNANLVAVQPCDAVDDWQKRMQWRHKDVKQKMMGSKTEKGPGPVFGLLTIVDSLMGKLMLETQTRIERQGFAGRNWAVEALSITNFLKKVPQDIRRWPFSVLTVNHLKMHKDPNTGATIRNKAGGKHLDFQETYELEMIKSGRFTRKDGEGIKLFIKCQKNSLGVTGRKIPVEVMWWEEEIETPDGVAAWRQHTVWDWHKATVDVLLGLDGPAQVRRREIVDLRVVSRGDKGKGVYSKVLGIPKSDPQPYFTAGKAIMDDVDVLTQLRRAFGVKMRRQFTPGVNYRKQIAEEKRKIAEKLR